MLYPRFSAAPIATALRDTPVVMVTGPRQCGKTTLVRELVADGRQFVTMDDDTMLASARSDPAGLVRGLGKPTIDEIQRAPDLLRAIKKSVDEPPADLTRTALYPHRVAYLGGEAGQLGWHLHARQIGRNQFAVNQHGPVNALQDGAHDAVTLGLGRGEVLAVNLQPAYRLRQHG